MPTRRLVLDLAVPESPAFEVLGFTPERVSRPTSPRELAANLLNGVDERGNLQTGIALDTAPYLLARGSDVSLAAYRKDYLTRFASRAQLSLATTKGSSDADESVRLGLGLKTTIWDAGDPRDDPRFSECLGTAHEAVLAGLDRLFAEDPPEDLAEINRRMTRDQDDAESQAFLEVAIRLHKEAVKEAGAAVATDATKNRPALETQFLRSKLTPRLADRAGNQDALAARYLARILEFFDPAGLLQRGQVLTRRCFEEAKLRNWNRPSWDIGGALAWISPAGEIDGLESSGGAIWTSLALNLPDRGWWGLVDAPDESRDRGEEPLLSEFVREHFQLILHARYRPDQEVPEADGTGTTEEDVALVGARLRVGTPRWALSGEGAYTHTKPRGGSGEGSAFYSIGGEYRLTDDLWLQVSVGSQSGNDQGSDEATILGSLKYGFSSSSPFDTWEALAVAPN